MTAHSTRRPSSLLSLALVIVSIILFSSSSAVSAQHSNSSAHPGHTSSVQPTIPSPPSSPAVSPQSGYVLVLGSGGLIGSALTEWLHTHRYPTVLVHNRSHVDLRDPSALPSHLSSLSIPPSSLSFAFFLACEVGGSKFLQSPSPDTRTAILHHNLALYHSVLPFLSRHSIPFLFTSSYLSHLDSPYGSIKRLGEQLTALQPLGRTLRLWNVYGRETPGLKAHVLTDWALGCQAGHVQSVTDGWEWRQFLHVGDVADAMGRMMGGWERMPRVTDLSSGEWVTMRQVGAVVEAVATEEGRRCSVQFREGVQGDRMEGGAVREKMEPDLASAWWRETGWKPRIALVEGVRDLFRHYGETEGAGMEAQGKGERRPVAAEAAGPTNHSAVLVYPRSSAPPYAVRSGFAARTA